MNRRQDEDRTLPRDASPTGGSALPYTIELYDLPKRAPERVLGRAASMVLARAIFAAAQTEHLGRRIVLRRGRRVVAQSG